ncbi:response regulator [Puniceicoccales bacterium CK1056]|uniref:Response regulator n=1 Tax=Oceanipulchritudo coccoides TaxID=2706888 RepID=A0A6B2LYE4_9BACT|nr:response regulator [Oceanipulchritudo coccoides]NDV61152.1 response regulator [Oceanipulchritudo coccoides]
MSIPRTALVADDENHIRSYVRIILTHLGVEEVFEARTGDEALVTFQEKNPDIVFLDINMPGMTGLEVLPKIMEIDEDAVVIMLTGHASRHLVEHAAQAGAIHYIRKDTPQQEISSMLKTLFDELDGGE